MSEAAVFFRAGAPVAEIVLNRPKVLNAMNMAWVTDFERAAAEAGGAPVEPRVVIVRGEGRAICAGLDLTMTREAGGMPAEFYPKQEEGFCALEGMGRLVIAQIHGYCLGGGVQLAVACDIRIASDEATFAIPAPTEGLFPGMAVWRLPRFIGLGRAMRLALSGERVGAAEALQLGLVDYVCPADKFEESAREIVARYVAVSPAAARATKRMMRSAFERDFQAVYAESLPLLEASRTSSDVLNAAAEWERRRLERKKSD